MAQDDVEEKRVYGDRAGKRELLVAASMGVLVVEVSGPRVGRFGVAHRCSPTDVAASGRRVAVATDGDVLVRDPDDEAFEATGFGRAVAVGFDDDPVAAGPGGRVGRLDVDGRGVDDRAGDDADSAWTDIGHIDAEVRAIDGRLLAAADGVYRLPGPDFAGLDDARDVAAAGPLVATGDGLYSLGNGWMDELDGAFSVATVGEGPAGSTTAHAATDAAFFERSSDAWSEVALPVDGPIVDVAYGDVVYGVTADGHVVARDEDGWRSQALGVEGVVGCAVI